MEKTVLVEKRDAYLEIKSKLEAQDFSEEIEEQVLNFRRQLTEEYEKRRAADIAKCNCYLQVIDECLTEIAERENKSRLERIEESREYDESVATAE